MEDLIPPRFRDTFSRLFDEVGRILAAYTRGQLLIALCMAVLYAIGFAALGVPAWAGIAALAGLLNAILMSGRSWVSHSLPLLRWPTEAGSGVSEAL